MREGKAEERIYDKWFYSLPKKRQKELRDNGCNPYGDMPLARYSFPVYKNSNEYATEDNTVINKNYIPESEEQTWITKERVTEIISDVLAMLGSSDNQEVINHFDLVRIMLNMPGAPMQKELGERMGLTKQAISIRAKNILMRASDIAPGLLARVKMAPRPIDKEPTWTAEIVAKAKDNPPKESFNSRISKAWATHHGGKSQRVSEKRLQRVPGSQTPVKALKQRSKKASKK